MARIQTGGLVTGISGSIGGLTYSKTKSGAIAKQKGRSARRMRTTQPGNRSRIGYLARQWGTLSQAVRESWETWAAAHPFTDKFGDPFIGSGCNAFISINAVRMRVGDLYTYDSAPPVGELSASLADFTVETGATNPGDIDLSWEFNGVESGSDFIEIAVAGPFLGQGRQQVFNLKRFNSAIAGDETDLTLSGLTELAYYHVFARYVGADGQTSAWQAGYATPKVTV